MRRPVLVLLAVAVLVLALAEVATRVTSSYLEEPLLYADEATQVKVAQLDERAATGCVDLVVAGDSMARDAFDPTVFAASGDGATRAYNASLDAATPALLRRWLTDEVVPRVAPTTVVIVVSSLDLNANGAAPRSALQAYDSAQATAAGTMGAAQRRLLDASALYRYRTMLRDPERVSAAFQRWQDGTSAARHSATGIEGVLGADGQGLSRRALRYRQDLGTRTFTREQLLGRYQLDATQVTELHDLIGALRDRDIDVAVAVLPVTDDYVALHPRGPADFDAFLDAMRSTTAATGVPLIDLHDAEVPPESFADTHHLNANGATWFSSELPGRLAGAGVPVERRCA